MDNATPGRHRGLSTIYIGHNLFHQSKPELDVIAQKMHIVLFISPRDVMQVSTISAQLSLGLELDDCYRDATSVLTVSNLLICRRVQTLDYVFVQTVDPFYQIFITRLFETFETFGRGAIKVSLFAQCSNNFPANAKVFASSFVQKSLSGFSMDAK